jgi:hypothetical protein
MGNASLSSSSSLILRKPFYRPLFIPLNSYLAPEAMPSPNKLTQCSLLGSSGTQLPSSVVFSLFSTCSRNLLYFLLAFLPSTLGGFPPYMDLFFLPSYYMLGMFMFKRRAGCMVCYYSSSSSCVSAACTLRENRPP